MSDVFLFCLAFLHVQNHRNVTMIAASSRHEQESVFNMCFSVQTSVKLACIYPSHVTGSE